MKLTKPLAIILVLALTFSIGSALNVTKEAPDEIMLGEDIEVTVEVINPPEKIDVVEFIPNDSDIKSWQISGNETPADFREGSKSYVGKARKYYRWNFTNSTNFTLTYNIQPDRTGNFELITLWTYPEGFDQVVESVEVFEEKEIEEEDNVTKGKPPSEELKRDYIKYLPFLLAIIIGGIVVYLLYFYRYRIRNLFEKNPYK